MKKIFKEKLLESIKSVLPITIVILIVGIIVGIPLVNASKPLFEDLLAFILGAISLIIGLAIFLMGSSTSMELIADKIGMFIAKRKKISVLVSLGFLIGFLITISEPDLGILAEQFPMDSLFLIAIIGLGVAILLVVGLLRIVFGFNIRYLIGIGYGIVILMAILIPLVNPNFNNFIPFSFDASGVTTGPMAVPFIIALGLGLCSSKGDNSDSFGLVGIASIGPIIAVMVMAIFSGDLAESPEAELGFFEYLFENAKSVLLAITPFVIFFIIFQIYSFKLPRKTVARIVFGFILTYIGLVVFITGAESGFVYMGKAIGEIIGKLDYSWVMIPLGMLFGAVVILAEPAVLVLNKQVEEASSNTISRKIMMIFLAIGVSFAIGLAMLKIYFKIPIVYFVIPGYVISFILTFFVPKKFIGIAYDSGGAVSGVLTSSFLITLALGFASALEANIFEFAFGLVALVAMMPILTIQLLGIFYMKKPSKQIASVEDEEIINL
ncbi:MAG: DUF1538 domain-containing protein [Acholeplasmatales bacterium]|nr:DUF1538 domain-containing protein [Acholeplasmatales bacterium]